MGLIDAHWNWVKSSSMSRDQRFFLLCHQYDKHTVNKSSIDSNWFEKIYYHQAHTYLFYEKKSYKTAYYLGSDC